MDGDELIGCCVHCVLRFAICNVIICMHIETQFQCQCCDLHRAIHFFHDPHDSRRINVTCSTKQTNKTVTGSNLQTCSTNPEHCYQMLYNSVEQRPWPLLRQTWCWMLNGSVRIWKTTSERKRCQSQIECVTVSSCGAVLAVLKFGHGLDSCFLFGRRFVPLSETWGDRCSSLVCTHTLN